MRNHDEYCTTTEEEAYAAAMLDLTKKKKKKKVGGKTSTGGGGGCDAGQSSSEQQRLLAEIDAATTTKSMHESSKKKDEEAKNCSTYVEDDSSSTSTRDSSDDDSTSTSSSSSSTGENDNSLQVESASGVADESNEEDYDEYAAQVQCWVQRVPIGLGLCPWAIKSASHIRRRLKYVTCEGSTPQSVARQILSEARALLLGPTGAGDGAHVHLVPDWSTTLIVCPHVAAWQNDFALFDHFVKNLATSTTQQEINIPNKEGKGRDVELEYCHDHDDMLQQITLVSFHPEFLRWRGLPPRVKVGSVVQSHRGSSGFQKTQQTFSATLLQTHSSVFGERRSKVRFHDNGKEQFVPNDWLVFQGLDGECSNDKDDHDLLLGPPLPDNAMHRTPYPTVHLIRNSDLGTLCVRDVSRVKRINAKRIMKLGWEGMLQKAMGTTASTARTEAQKGL
jgi:hypothetical protein